MRILIDILHSAHVHVFRNFVAEMRDRGHDVVITSRDKDVTVDLLAESGLDHRVLSVAGTGRLGLARELAVRLTRLDRVVREVRPDVLAGIMGPAIAPVGAVRRIPTVVLYDTEFATITNRWVYRLASAVVTPSCYAGPVPGRHVTYPGYHELAYLHPARFTPDPARVRAAGLDPERGFSVVRFVSWQASHDTGELAVPAALKRAIVARLEEEGPVVISSESPLPSDLAPLAWQGPRRDLHHLVAHARIVVGESATMASEAAVLGTPAVFIAKTSRGYIDDQEARYGLMRHLPPHAPDDVMKAIDRMLETPPETHAAARRRLLDDTVDVTAWLVDWFDAEGWAT